MSIPYCTICGSNHRRDNKVSSESLQQEFTTNSVQATWRTTTARMATCKTKNDEVEISNAMAGILIVVKEKATRAAIEKIEESGWGT